MKDARDREIELCNYWYSFCEADYAPDGFCERMEACGYIYVDSVNEDDLESPFASERGIEREWYIWRLTDAGRAALEGKAIIAKEQEA